MTMTDAVLIAALGFAVYILVRLGKLQAVAAASPAPLASGIPPGAPVVPLGQFAVRSSAQWLIQPSGT